SFDVKGLPPAMASSIPRPTTTLARGSEHLATTCTDEITANAERARELAESSPSIVTPLNRLIGYEAAAKIAKHAVEQGITVRRAVEDLGYVQRGEVSAEQLDAVLDVTTMTHPG